MCGDAFEPCPGTARRCGCGEPPSYGVETGCLGDLGAMTNTPEVEAERFREMVRLRTAFAESQGASVGRRLFVLQRSMAVFEGNAGDLLAILDPLARDDEHTLVSQLLSQRESSIGSSSHSIARSTTSWRRLGVSSSIRGEPPSTCCLPGQPSELSMTRVSQRYLRSRLRCSFSKDCAISSFTTSCRRPGQTSSWRPRINAANQCTSMQPPSSARVTSGSRWLARISKPGPTRLTSGSLSGDTRRRFIPSTSGFAKPSNQQIERFSMQYGPICSATGAQRSSRSHR